MEQMAISRFKATCLSVLKRVKRTGQPIRITRFGEPVADIVPPSLPAGAGEWMGSMEGSGRIVGDIVGPVVDEEEWEVLGS